MDLKKAEHIKKRYEEYTEKLYRNYLNDLDNHDGVVTHLETDILESKVKWTSGWWLCQAGLPSVSITTVHLLSQTRTAGVSLDWKLLRPPRPPPPVTCQVLPAKPLLTVSIFSSLVGSRHHPVSCACDSLFLTRPHVASLSLAPTHPPDSSQRSFPAGASGQEWGCRIRHDSATEQPTKWTF